MCMLLQYFDEVCQGFHSDLAENDMNRSTHTHIFGVLIVKFLPRQNDGKMEVIRSFCVVFLKL